MHIIESGDVAKPVATLLPLTKLSSNDAYYSTLCDRAAEPENSNDGIGEISPGNHAPAIGSYRCDSHLSHRHRKTTVRPPLSLVIFHKNGEGKERRVRRELELKS